MLCIVRPKACRRCGGDLSLECDIYGVYAECIQCGANWSKHDMNYVTTKAKNKHQETEPAKPVAIVHSHRQADPG